MAMGRVMSARDLLCRSLARCSLLYVNTGRPFHGVLGAQRPFASNSPFYQESDEEGLREARRWLSSFTPDLIPRECCDVSFSRSAGPGGQNVNKSNTKATLRFDLDKARKYLTKSNELVISSDTYRRQPDNESDCFRKLYQSIVEAAALPGETSAEQKDHVSKLKRDENERRVKMKKQHSNKKSSRRSKGDY